MVRDQSTSAEKVIHQKRSVVVPDSDLAALPPAAGGRLRCARKLHSYFTESPITLFAVIDVIVNDFAFLYIIIPNDNIHNLNDVYFPVVVSNDVSCGTQVSLTQLMLTETARQWPSTDPRPVRAKADKS